MTTIIDYPILVFALSLVMLWLSAQAGMLLRRLFRGLHETELRDFDVIVSATLTLLGLIIGFGFSMVVSRYDQRKNYEAIEANAISTEYARADLLPPADAAAVQRVLREYVDERILFYEASDTKFLEQVRLRTAKLQTELWALVEGAAEKKPIVTVGIAVAGMNEVLDSQGYTEAAWWNRLPPAAWFLLVAIAILCNLLIGYTSRQRRPGLFLILPLAVSISLFLIADIDSPRHGLIRMAPQNLIALSQALKTQ